MTDNPCPCPGPLAPCAAFGGIVLGEYRWRVCRGEELTPELCAAYRRKWAGGPGAGSPTATVYQPSPPKPVSEWPWYARALTARRAPGERGLGDTAHRLLGGDVLPRLYRRLTGRDCGCGDRQARLNAQYPYPPI